MARGLKEWESKLLASTWCFVNEQLPDLPLEKREEVLVRIYADMRRTLKLFHKDDTA